MADQRPDPEALLAAIQETSAKSESPRLRVYLGMAAGVGKTYSMLQDAADAKRRGIDVVLGYLEAHGRKETEDLAAGLEMLPRKEIPYGGTTLYEFDLDAAIARKPDLVLVDELAHSNATGCRHRKRYQDILELLDAGIDVATTVNVQHVESLNDAVAKITGVIVREKIPDSFLARADEIELVDVPPEELIQRLKEGKIYVPDKIQQALDGFFKKGNLSALREMALRKTAERVDAQVLTYRTAAGSLNPWPSAPRVMICVAPNQLAARVVRSSFALANALHSEVVAVTVDSPRQAGASEAERLEASRALHLAESLGARAITLAGTDIVGEVLRAANERNITMIVVGKPVRPRWREILFGSVVDDLVRRSGDIDVHVITGDESEGGVIGPRTHGHKLTPRGIAEAVVANVVATILCTALKEEFDKANLVMVYLVGVTVVASRQGFGEAILASIIAVGAFDFFFVQPHFTFAVSDAQYLLTFAIMLLVAVFISSLTVRLREQTMSVSERERRTAALYDLSRRIAASRSRKQIGTFAQEKIRELLGCDSGIWRKDRRETGLVATPASLSGFDARPAEQAVAYWALERNRAAGSGTDTLPGAEGMYLPLAGAESVVGVLAVMPLQGQAFSQQQIHLLETIASQVALAIERANLARSSIDARVEAEAERLRNTLLSSVSHDLRTPLAVISGSAAKLADVDEPPTDLRRELASGIVQEADRLNRLVRNLLDMTRLENPGLELKRDWNSVEEIIGSALQRTQITLADRPVLVDVPEDLPMIKVDGVLVEQMVVNLLENAARHTPGGTEVRVSASAEAQWLTITVADRGPGVPVEQLQAVFQKFRKQESSPGVGLGLAICQAIVEAHGGKIKADNAKPTGAVFRASFPIERNPEVTIGE